MSNTGTYGENNAPQYGAPPTYVDPNAPPQYGAPPSYNQPPATNPNYAAPPPAAGSNQPNYAAPPPAAGFNQPNYAAPPPAAGFNQPNYAAPPSGGYVPPNQTGPNYTQPPPTGPSYAQPGPNYAQPPPGGPSYAGPPASNQPSYMNPLSNALLPGPTTTTVTTHTSVHVQGQGGLRTDWNSGLCDIPCNKWCCYVFWCNACAIADLKASFDGNAGTWWITVSVLSLLWFLSMCLLGVPGAWAVLNILYNIAACVFLMQIANQLREKLRIRESDCCCDCMQSWFCVPCRTCQLGRELEPISVPEVRELVLNLQRASPCKQSCMHDHVIA